MISDDPVARPGIVEVKVALPEMSEAERDSRAARAVELIEETRPGRACGCSPTSTRRARSPGRARPNPGDDSR